MKLKAVVDSLDTIDEALRAHYIEFDDGGTTRYKLDIEGVPTHPEARALQSAHERTKTTLRETRANLVAAEAKLEDIPEDFDLDLYERAKTEGVGGPGGKLPNEDEIRSTAAAAATKKAEEKFAKERDTLTTDRDRIKNALETKVKREAVDAQLDANGILDPHYRRGARAILMGAITVHEEDGEYVALAKDRDLGDIPLAEHVKTWAQTDEGKAYVSARDSAGGGANGGGTGGNAPSSTDNPWKAGDTFNVTKQAQIRNSDPDLAKKLMKEAGLAI